MSIIILLCLVRILFGFILCGLSIYGIYVLYENADLISRDECLDFSTIILVVVIVVGLLGVDIVCSLFCLEKSFVNISNILLFIIYLVTNIYFVGKYIMMNDFCRNFYKDNVREYYIFILVNFTVILLLFLIFLIRLIIIIFYKYGIENNDSTIELI